MSNEIKIEGLNERISTIEAPPEEMKAFTAGLRVGYKKGFEAGYAQAIAESLEKTQPSEILFNRPVKPN